MSLTFKKRLSVRLSLVKQRFRRAWNKNWGSQVGDAFWRLGIVAVGVGFFWGMIIEGLIFFGREWGLYPWYEVTWAWVTLTALLSGSFGS